MPKKTGIEVCEWDEEKKCLKSPVIYKTYSECARELKVNHTQIQSFISKTCKFTSVKATRYKEWSFKKIKLKKTVVLDLRKYVKKISPELYESLSKKQKSIIYKTEYQ